MLPAVPSSAEECSRREPCNRIGQQAHIGNAIAAQAEEPRYQAVEPTRTVRREWTSAQAELRFLFPLAPQQPQMRKVQFMRQERQQPLRMKLVEGDAIGRCGIGADEECKEVFVDLDGEVADSLLVLRQYRHDIAVADRASGCRC